MLKCGRVRNRKPYGMRLPSTFCCPTQAVICEMLMKDPFEPASTIRLTRLYCFSDFCASLPASSRAELSTWLTSLSKVSFSVMPALRNAESGRQRKLGGVLSLIDEN